MTRFEGGDLRVDGVNIRVDLRCSGGPVAMERSCAARCVTTSARIWFLGSYVLRAHVLFVHMCCSWRGCVSVDRSCREEFADECVVFWAPEGNVGLI